MNALLSIKLNVKPVGCAISRCGNIEDHGSLPFKD